jgi:ferredoxin-type protein NapH
MNLKTLKSYKWITGRKLLVLSVVSRVCVLLLLCLFAMWTEYLNLKIGYNNPRLVELSSGKAMRVFYEYSDAFFSLFGDPVDVLQTNGGMTWSIRIMGIPFTDPIAALSVGAKDHHWELGFALGLIIPVGIALVFGRVFCSYVCPASLLFFTIARIRRLLARFFYFPNLPMNRGLAWGVLIGGLVVACWYGHGLWTLILPYFSIGQTLFHGLAFGTLSVAVVSIIAFALIDLMMGHQFTCRHICPTGRLLGFIGRKSLVSVRRDAARCLDNCHSCHDVCPLQVNPKMDETRDCSLCGECLTICPTNCLTVGLVRK